MSYLNLNSNYRIVVIQEIGNEMSAIVVEHKETKQVRFLRVYYSENSDKDDIADDIKEDGFTRRLKIVQLGVMPNFTKMAVSPVIKYRSVVKKDPKTEKFYQVSLVLRENGRIEVYSDFMLVYEYFNPRK